MSAFLTSRGADFASPSANTRPSAPAAGHPESLVSAVFTPPPTASIAAKQRQESVRALAAMVTAVRRLENLFLSDVAASWVPSKGLELMQAHNRSTGGASAGNMANGTSANSSMSAATGRSPFGAGHAGGTSAISGALDASGGTTATFPPALTAAYAALGAADASDLSEVSHLFSQLRDRLYSMLAERVTVVEKRTLGTDTHRLQSAKERESTYQYGYHGGMVGGGCGVGCGVGCGDHSHHSHHHHRETSQRRRPAPAVPPVVHVTAKAPGSSADFSGAFGRGGLAGSYDDRSNSMDAPHHQQQQQQQQAAAVGSSDRFSVNPAFDQTHSTAAAAFADGHASTMGRYESESPVRRAVSNEPIIRIPHQTHVVHRSTASGAATGVAPHSTTTSAAPKALSYVQYGQQQQQQQQLNASTASGSFVSAASPGSLHVHSRRTQSQLAASRTTDADRSASFAGSVTGNDVSGTATAGPNRVGNAPRARSPPRSAVVMLKGQTRMRGAPETPQSNAAAMQARKRLLVGGPGSDGQYAAVPTSRSGNNSRSASGYQQQQPHDRSGSAAYGSGGFGPVGVGVEGRGGALVARSPPRGRTHQQQLQEGFSYRVGAAHPTPRTTANTIESSDMAAAPPSATAGSGFILSIPDEVPSLFGGAGAHRPPPQFHDGQVFNAQEAHMQQQQASAASLSSTNFGGGGSVGGDRAMTNYAGASPPSSDVITASLRRAMNNIVDGTADAHGGDSHHNGNSGAVGGTFFPRRSPFPHASIGSAVDSNDPSPVGVPLVAAVSEDTADRMAPLRSTEQAQLIGRPATPSSALGSGLATAPPPRALTDTPLLDTAGGAFAPRSGSVASSSHHAGSGGGAGVGNTHVKLVVRPALESESNDTMTAAAAGGTPPPPPPPEAATLRSGTMTSTAPMTPTTVATSGQRAATADGRPIDGRPPGGATIVAHHPASSTDALDPMAATARPSSHVDPAAAATAAARKANSTSPVRRPQAHVDGDTGSESGGTPPQDDDSHKKRAAAIPNTDPFAATVAAASASRGAANSRSATAKTDAEGDAREPNSVGAIPPIGGGAKGLPATTTAAIRSTTEVAEVILLPPTRDELQWHRQALVHPLSLPAGLAVRGPSPFARAGPIVPKATTTGTTTTGDDAAGSVSIEGDNSRAAARRFGSARRGGSAAPVARLQALGAAAASRFMVVDVVGAGNLSGNGGGAASAFASAWVRDPAVPRGTARLLRTATAPRMANPVWGRGNGPTRIVVNTAEAMQAHQAELQKAAVAANSSTGPAPQPPALSLVVSNDLYLPEELMYEGGVALGSNSALSRDAICPCSGLARIPLTLRSERPVSQLRVPLELPGEKDPRQRVPTDGFIALRITQLAPAPARILGQPMPQPPEGATGADAYVPAAWLVMNLRRVSALPAAMLARGVFSHVDIVASFRKAAAPPQSAETNGADAQAAPAGGAAVGGEVDDGRILARCFGMPPTLADAARLAATGGDLDHDFSVGGVAAMRWPGSQNDVNALEIRLRVYVMPRPGANNASDESKGKKGKKKEDESAAAGKEQQQPRGPRPVCVATAVLPAASVLSQRCGTLLLYAVPEPGVVEQFEKESGVNSGNTGFFSRFRSKEKTATPIAAEVDSVLVEVDLTPTVETGFGAVPSAQSSQTPTRALIPPVTFGAATASSLAAGLDAMPSVAVDQFFAATSAPLNPAAAGAQLAQRQREFMKFQQKAETAHEKAVVSVIGVAAVRAALESPRRARSLSPGASRGGSVPRQPSTGSGAAAAATSAPPSLPPSGGALPRRQPSNSVSSSVGATFGTDSPVAVPPTPPSGGTASNSPPGSIPMASGIRMPVLPAQQQQMQQQHSGSAVSSPPPSRLTVPPPPPSSAAIGVPRTAAMTDSLAEASFGPGVAAAGSTSSGSQSPSSNRGSAVIAPPPTHHNHVVGPTPAIAGAPSGIPPLAVARAVVVGSGSVAGYAQQPVQAPTTPRPAAVVTASAPVVVASAATPSAVTPVVPTKASAGATPAATANGGGGGVSTSRRQIMERFRHKGSSDSESD